VGHILTWRASYPERPIVSMGSGIEQMATFASASESLSEQGIKVVAFSVNDEATTKEFISERKIPF
jgi:peroxiredoxin